MRTQRFIVAVDVKGPLVGKGDVLTMVAADLDEASREPMRGPRGGRYERIGDLGDLEREIIFERNVVRFWRRFTGKYIRPKR